MPLTRHLYEIDEVVSALQMCLRRNLPAALFWVWELVQSAEEELALSTLRDTWLRYGSGRDPTLLTVSPNEPADWCSLVMRVRFACRSHISTVLFLNEYSDKLIYPTIASVQSPSPSAFLKAAASESIDLKLATRIWKFLYNAANSQNDKSAISVLQAMQPILSADTIWISIEALEPTFSPLLRTHASPLPESQILHQAAALFIACTPPNERSVSPDDLPPVSHIQHSWDKWSANLGRRAARVHEIPSASLHKETTRGRIPCRYTNIADIRDPVAELPQGCRWWREQTAALGIHLDEDGALVFPSDDVLETFYERHFPDDIPDEWSAKDQQKSHGRGTADTAPDPPPALHIRESPVDQTAWILPCPAVNELATRLSKV